MNSNQRLLQLLSEIREACAVATSMDDVSMNTVIEEINLLTQGCIALIED